MIYLKQAHEEAVETDGERVLVDRLWPRGLAKERAKIDNWPKELTPSKELSKWYHHHGEQHAEFKRRYLAELAANLEAQISLRVLAGRSHGERITLVYGTKDPLNNHGVILSQLIVAQFEGLAGAPKASSEQP